RAAEVAGVVRAPAPGSSLDDERLVVFRCARLIRIVIGVACTRAYRLDAKKVVVVTETDAGIDAGRSLYAHRKSWNVGVESSLPGNRRLIRHAVQQINGIPGQKNVVGEVIGNHRLPSGAGE